MAELRALAAENRKIRLLAVSIDPPARITELRSKIAKDGKGDVNFPLLSDTGGKTINAYGLYDLAYGGKGFDGIPHPAVYIIDKKGKVVWARIESDYRKRPTLDELRTEIAKLK